MRNPLTTMEMEAISRVAMGLEKSDIVLLHGDVVDVYTGLILPCYSVAIKGNWIAAVSQNIERCIGENTQVIDVTGKIIAPGFVDGHAHLNYLISPSEFLRRALLGGTTTIITESMEIAYTAGIKGILEFIRALQHQPIKIYVTIPPPNNLNQSVYDILPSIAQYKKLLRSEGVVGLGETYWQMVLQGNKYFPELAREALALGKTVEGHAAGAHEEKLTAYLAYGITSCHESVSIDDVLERLRMGIFVMLREGSIRQELDAMIGLRDIKINFSRLSLVTDGLDPRYLYQHGSIEVAIQKAINLGFDFIQTMQMVSINPAIYFHLQHFTGGIAPCKHADIVVLPDTKTILPEMVLSYGRIIAQRGELLTQPRKTTFTIKSLAKLKKHINPCELKINAPQETNVKVRLLDMVTELVTREQAAYLTPVKGEVQADIQRDILKITLVGLHYKIANALIRGIGIQSGAIASSYIWETYGIIAIGANDIDMTSAINRVIDLAGGIVICNHNTVVAELQLPIAAIMSDLPLESVSAKLNHLQHKSEELGCKLPDIVKTLSVLTTGAIPFLRITENGLLNIRNNTLVSLFDPGIIGFDAS